MPINSIYHYFQPLWSSHTCPCEKSGGNKCYRHFDWYQYHPAQSFLSTTHLYLQVDSFQNANTVNPFALRLLNVVKHSTQCLAGGWEDKLLSYRGSEFHSFFSQLLLANTNNRAKRWDLTKCLWQRKQTGNENFLQVFAGEQLICVARSQHHQLISCTIS